jgi:hypothetical protein
MRVRKPALLFIVGILAFVLTGVTVPAAAGRPEKALGQRQRNAGPRDVRDPAAALERLDAAAGKVISEGPAAKVTKNLQLRGRGKRLDPQATTDVWAYKGFAYTGTFNSPCGGEEGAGIWVWNIRNKNKPSFVDIIESETGSRSNDVRSPP